MQRAHGTPACASCKHQRKKCTDKCILAPLFPAEKTREFQAVHKVFGVNKVTKMVRNLNQENRKQAVDSLVWEAFWRQRDPVLGPYGEYIRVIEELKNYRSSQINQGLQNYHHHHHNNNNQVPIAQAVIGASNTAWNVNHRTPPASMNIGGGIASNNNGIINNNQLSYIQENGSTSIVDSCLNDYYSPLDHHQNMEKVRQETIDNGSAVILPQPQQQHHHHHNSVNGFNQSYYLSGHYFQNDAKRMKNPLWEGSS